MALITIASAIIGAAIAEGGLILLGVGFFVMGAVWPCLMPRHHGWRCRLFRQRKGGRVRHVNACTFLGGSVGIAGGAIVFAIGGFVAVLTMVALAGIIGSALSRGIPNTG